MSQAFPRLCRWPQFAYLPHRSTQDAINKVRAHCSLVRDLVQSQRRSVSNRYLGVQTHQACGGVQLFLDLSRAFDSIDRNILFQQLHCCGISGDLISLMQAFHFGTRYHLQFQGQFYPIDVSLGVRQGCKAAPILWACLMVGFLHRAAQSVDPVWLQKHLTIYADDIHIGVPYHCIAELQDALHKIGLLLDILSDFGLTVNVAKSQMVFAMAGTNHRRHYRDFVQFTAEGIRMRVPRQQGETTFRVTDAVVYLGVKLGYRNMETHTLNHRLSSAHATFRRLRRWLTSKSWRIQHRLALWRSCVFPTLTYGIFTVGITHTGMHKLQTTVYQMLRTVIGDHAYVTGHTHQQALARHQCAAPLQLFLDVVTTLKQSLTQRCQLVPFDDIVHSLDWSQLDIIINLLHAEMLQGTQVLIDPDPCEVPTTMPWLTCPFCDFQTHLPANLKRHCTNIHAHSFLRIHSVDWRVDTLHGLPQCKHCLRKFTTWHSFRRHVETGVCQVRAVPDILDLPRHSLELSVEAVCPPSQAAICAQPDSGEDIPEYFDLCTMANSACDGELRVKLLPCDLAHLHSTAEGSFILEVVNSLNWHQLSQHDQACKILTEHCALCGIYVGKVRELLGHLKLYHADLMTHVLAKSAQLTLVYARNSPCDFCKRSFKTGHICPVLVQAALLLVNGGGLDVVQGLQCVNRILVCDICDAHLSTVRELQKHLRDAHKLAIQDWNSSRDAIGGTTCAHCGGRHTSVDGLRRHITFGHCDQFDYSRSSNTKSLDDHLVKMLQEGTVLRALQDASFRTGLTLSCQCCGESYSRAADLTAHLQQCHGHLWTQAASLTQMLTDVVIRQFGCICNPSNAVQLSSHVCIGLKQMAMQFLRLPPALLVPYEFNAAQVTTILRSSLTPALVQSIVRTLLTREFVKLWTDADLLRLLRSHCCLCGKQLHAAELGEHLCQDHANQSGLVVHFQKQIVSLMHYDALSDDWRPQVYCLCSALCAAELH